MDINISTFMLLFLRLAPFILVCFFTISSIFSGDIKGIIYLFGLIFAIGIVVMLSSTITDLLSKFTDLSPNMDSFCEAISFGNTELSNLPISHMIITFTFSYLLTFMYKNGDVITENSKGEEKWNGDNFDIISKQNWPTLTFFLLIIVAQLWYDTNLFNFMKGTTSYCYNYFTSLSSYIIGFGLGILWAIIIMSMNTPEFTYFSKYKNDEKCEKPTKNTFKCKVYKNGEVIAEHLA
jgi:hypothetical protein